MAKKKSVKEGVDTVNDILQNTLSNAVAIKSIRLLSPDATYNLTCFLMANYGDVMTGLGESDWKEEAKIILKIVAKK